MLYDSTYVKCPEQVSPQRQKRARGEVTANGDGVSSWDDGNVLELDRDDGCTTL